MKRLPPYGKSFQPVPKSGVQVAIGPGAWEFAEAKRNIPNGWNIPIIVLPCGECARSYSWPSHSAPALVYEKGEVIGDREARGRLMALAQELLIAGATSVVALNDADPKDPRVFFDREASNVAT